MTGWKKTLILIIVFAVLIAGGTVLYQSLSDSVELPNPLMETSRADSSMDISATGEEGEISQSEAVIPLPDIGLTDWDGESVRLADFYGKPIVINFWASWCPPCKSEMPYFNTVYEEMGETVQFLMVNLTDGSRETVEKGKAYVEEQAFTFPVYFDTNQEAAYTYGLSSIPVTLFLDKNGQIMTGSIGAISEETLRSGIDILLAPEELS